MKVMLAVLLLAAVLTAQIGAASHPLTNDDVQKLVATQIDPDVIAKVIQSSTTSFDTSPEALLKLKQAGVPQKVLEQMVVSQAAQHAEPASALATMMKPTLSMRAHAKETACAPNLAACPPSGCYPPDTDHGVMNMQKRHVPNVGQAILLTFNDFESLQQDAEQLVGSGGDVPKDDRAKLSELNTSGGKASEGSWVKIVGYLVGDPLPAHANTQESVNCSLLHVANNDFHIPLAATADSTDYEGIVVEMIPQGRDSHQGWDLRTLHRVMNMRKQVLVEGQLFYDNEHVVNNNPEDPVSGQPARSSLWEVHPITKFSVCKRDSCDPGQSSEWADLSEFATGH